MTHADTRHAVLPFRETPLFIPERLQAHLADAFTQAPDWASHVSLADPDLEDPSQNACVFRAGAGEKASQFIVDPYSLAALFELTRFGHGIAVNRNRKAADKGPRWYLKLTFANAPEDTMTVGRIVADALPYEEVLGSGGADLRKEGLTKRGGGKPKKPAQETAVKHAMEVARNSAPSGFDLAAYERNLWALFAALSPEAY